MIDVFNASTQKAEAGRSLSCEASLMFRASSRTVKVSDKHHLIKRKKKKDDLEKVEESKHNELYTGNM